MSISIVASLSTNLTQVVSDLQPGDAFLLCFETAYGVYPGMPATALNIGEPFDAVAQPAGSSWQPYFWEAEINYDVITTWCLWPITNFTGGAHTVTFNVAGSLVWGKVIRGLDLDVWGVAGPDYLPEINISAAGAITYSDFSYTVTADTSDALAFTIMYPSFNGDTDLLDDAQPAAYGESIYIHPSEYDGCVTIDLIKDLDLAVWVMPQPNITLQSSIFSSTIAAQYWLLYGGTAEPNNEQQVTQVGVLARINAGQQLRTTQAGVLVRIDQKVLRTTQAGALVRMSPLVVQATTVGVLVRVSPINTQDHDTTIWPEGDEATWRRYWQLSAEGQSIADVAIYGSGQNPTISTAKPHTGLASYSNDPNGNTVAFGFSFAATQTARCNLLFNHNGITPSLEGGAKTVNILTIDCAGTPISIQWNSSANALVLCAGFEAGTDLQRYPIDDIAADIFNQPDTWLSIGLVARLAEADGFVSFYINRMRIASWTGDTRIYASDSLEPISTITGIYAAGRLGDAPQYADWANSYHVDDFYADGGNGSEADLPAPFLRFFPRFRKRGAPDIKAEMAVFGAATNGEAIDDSVPDDASYVEATGGQEDIYPLTPAQIAQGWMPTRQIVIAYARKTDPVAQNGIALGINDTQSAETRYGADHALKPYYGYVGYSFKRDPSQQAWTAASIDLTALAIKAAGSFDLPE